jgi:hypothetical protein
VLEPQPCEEVSGELDHDLPKCHVKAAAPSIQQDSKQASKQAEVSCIALLHR